MKLKDRLKLATQIMVGKSTGRDSLEFTNFLKFLGINPDADGSALSEATYFACLKVLAEAMGKLPVRVMRYNEQHGVRADRAHPLFRVLHDRPNPYMTATTFWSTLEFNRNHYGNAYVWIDGAGEKMKLWILPSDQVEVWWDDAKLLKDQPDIYYLFSGGGRYYRLGSEEVLHFKSSTTFDGLVGVAVKDQLKSTIKGNVKSQQLVNNMYDSGFTAKAVLNYTGSLNDANVEELVKLTEAYGKGELKSKGIENIIPIPVGFSLQPLNIKLADNQFVEVKQYSAMQIASAFGIKPYQIGDYTKSSYASAEAQQLSFYVDTLLYIVKQYEEELGYKLLTPDEIANGEHIKFNVSVILRADLQTQINTLSTAVNSFLYTPNEAREYLDKEAIPGGDRLLGNGASIPVEFTGAQYTQQTSVEGQPVESETDEPDETPATPDELMKIIEALKAGKITYEQAVQILILTLEFEDDAARNLLGSPDDYEKPEPDPVEAPETNAEDETGEDEQTDEPDEEAPENDESGGENEPQEPETNSDEENPEENPDEDEEKALEPQAPPGPDKTEDGKGVK